MTRSLKELRSRVSLALQQRDRGATMVEYALLAAFIAIVALVGVQLLGSQISSLFTSIGNDL